MRLLVLAVFLQLGRAAVQGYLTEVPTGFNASQWAFISYNDPFVSVLSGAFNRSVFDAPFESETSDSSLAQT